MKSALGLLYLSVSRQMMFPLTPQITANTKSLDEIESKCIAREIIFGCGNTK